MHLLSLAAQGRLQQENWSDLCIPLGPSSELSRRSYIGAKWGQVPELALYPLLSDAGVQLTFCPPGPPGEEAVEDAVDGEDKCTKKRKKT